MITRRTFLASVLALPIVSLVQAQPRYLLGDVYPSSETVTPSGIRLQTNGFDVPRRKKERKSENWLLAQGVSQEYVRAAPDAVYDENAPDFGRFCDRLWARPDQLALWTDEAASRLWVDPRSVTVAVMPAPFWVQEAGQYRMSWAVGRTCYVAVVAVSLQDDGIHARVRNYRNEVAWCFENQVR